MPTNHISLKRLFYRAYFILWNKKYLKIKMKKWRRRRKWRIFPPCSNIFIFGVRKLWKELTSNLYLDFWYLSKIKSYGSCVKVVTTLSLSWVPSQSIFETLESSEILCKIMYHLCDFVAWFCGLFLPWPRMSETKCDSQCTQTNGDWGREFPNHKNGTLFIFITGQSCSL